MKAVTDVGTGGTYDIFVRALGEELNKRWGQGIVVEPHPGGNAVIGNRACAESRPLMAIRFAFSQPGADRKRVSLQEDSYTRSSFQPDHEFVLQHTGHRRERGAECENLDELAALAKAKPGTLNYVVPGIFQRIFLSASTSSTGRTSLPFRSRAAATR